MMRRLVRQLRSLFHKNQAEKELDEEIDFYLENQIERNRAQGMTEEEARRAARSEFGDVARSKEECRDARGTRWLEDLLLDLRYGVRMLMKQPGVTFVAVLTLALGIGANTAIFSVVDAVLLRPLPYPESDRLMRLFRGIPPNGGPVSITKYLFWREHNRTFESMAAAEVIGAGVNLTGGDEPKRIRAARVSFDYFRVFGISPAQGRSFSLEEDRPGGGRVVVISDSLWKQLFGADPKLLGKEIELSGERHTVIGIMPPGLQPDIYADVWAPLRPVALDQEKANPLNVIGRLKDGVTLEQARAEMDAVAQSFRLRYPAMMDDGETITIKTYQQLLVGDVRTSLLVLLGAVAFVLLIACANVASLLLARAAARQKEVAIRSALGAGRFHLIQQSLTESALLALLGGALGILVAQLSLKALLALVPGDLPRLSEIQMNGTALLFTLAVALSTGILFGLAPAFQLARVDLNSVLNESGVRASAGIRRSRLHSLIVVVEIGLSSMLLIGAALLIQTFANLRGVDPGFDSRNVLTMQLSLPEAVYSTTARVSNFFDQALQRIETLPGVEAAAAVTSLPLDKTFILPFKIQGMQKDHFVRWRMITPNYFKALRIPLRQGRYFTEGDSGSSPAVALINEAMARQYFPNKDPIGELFTMSNLGGEELGDQPRQIVGVVGDVKDGNLIAPVPPAVYVPDSQVPDGRMRFFNRILPANFVIRTNVDQLGIAAAVKREIMAVDSEQPIFYVRSLEQMTADSISGQKFQMTLVGIFSTVALILAAVGIYGVMAYSVSTRTGEIGIRMALGARSRDILNLIIGQGVILTLLGLALGLAGALALTRLIAGLLFGVSATDPLTFAVIALLLMLVAMLACYLPARRATKVDPIVALRCD